MGCTLAQTGEYNWTIHVRRLCGLISNYFDQLLVISRTKGKHVPLVFCHHSTRCCISMTHSFSPKIGCHGNIPQHLWTPSNTIPTAHLSPQPKQHLDRFSRFCTADCRVSLWHTWIKTKNDPYSGKLQTTSSCCHNLTKCLPLWAWLSKVKWLSLEYTYQHHLHTAVVIIVQCHTTWHYSTVRRGLGGSPFTHTFHCYRQCNRPPSRATVPTSVSKFSETTSTGSACDCPHNKYLLLLLYQVQCPTRH